MNLSIIAAYHSHASVLDTPIALARFIKQTHHQFQQKLDATLTPEIDILSFLQQRALWLDEILTLIWQYLGLSHESIALIALGGYGLKRIHPGSDADILILVSSPLTADLEQKLTAFIAIIWDCGIKLGSSVRSLPECHSDATADLSFYTNLLSMRFLLGAQAVYQDCHQLLEQVNTFSDFFQAKKLERETRYTKFQHTEYGLEPSVKESPGGLRDCDFITWLTLKNYQTADWSGLLVHEDITLIEYNWLQQASRFLWHIRYRLHLYSANKSERLYFEYQAKIADDLGFTGETLNDKISAFMQKYYQTVSEIREITDILSQYFTEKQQVHQKTTQILTPYCVLLENTLEITDINFLQRSPDCLLNLFVLIANNQHIIGFTATSLRLIRELAKIITRKQLYTIQGRQYFMLILSRYQGAFKALTLFHRLGLLSQYLPQMAALSGQMQYDLYHLYTVDAHTLFVVRNCEWIFAGNTLLTNDLPFSPQTTIRNPAILFLAGLLHDICKGQGGDHSGKGAIVAEQFCQEHGLAPANCTTVAWLVKHHLLMSEVAQHQDIGDETVIAHFRTIVGSHEHLSLLYLLTIADIHATNPALWNHWRSALLRDLYLITHQSLENLQQTEQRLDITTKQATVSALLAKQSQFDSAQIQALWQILGDQYFQLESINHIVWHTEVILKSLPDTVCFAIKPHRNLAGTDIFIYAPEDPYLFAGVCATFEKCFLTIVQARISAGGYHFGLQSYVVLEQSGMPLTEPARLLEIQAALNRLLSPLKASPPRAIVMPMVARHVKRSLKFFEEQIVITINNVPLTEQTCLILHAPDFPGLLARVAEAFVQCNIKVNSAIINTLDNKVEDRFTISDKCTGQPVTDLNRRQTLKTAIIRAIKLNN